MRQAARHIARVAFKQIPKHWDLDVVPGVSVEQRVEPLARVGCYVPGGRFPLPSSLLMTAVPARVAGVREVIVVCPRPEPAVMAAALEAGVTTMFRVGGAHAIAALAYGTATVPRVDKIVGPGNRYVAAAKALVAGSCAIDFYAGPTEIVIVAGTGRPAWIAADLIAQAEHDPDARAIFITWRRALAERVAGAVAAQSAGRAIAERSLSTNGTILVTRSDREAMDIANRIAPEHLVVDHEALVRRPVTAGACSSVLTPRRRPAITRPDRTTCSRRRARPDSEAASAPPISSASCRCNAPRGTGSRAWRRRFSRSRARRAGGARAIDRTAAGRTTTSRTKPSGPSRNQMTRNFASRAQALAVT